MNAPLRVAIQKISFSVYVSTNWRISKADSTYHLYDANDFGPAANGLGIPVSGDVFGLVQQLLHKARREDSGIVSIRVESRSLVIGFSAACTPQSIRDLFMDALRTCGFRYEIVSDDIPEVLPA